MLSEPECDYTEHISTMMAAEAKQIGEQPY